MSRVHDVTLRLLMASLVLCSCFVATTLAQTPSPSPSPSPEASKTPDNTKQQLANPFAPEKTQPLPPGMTGSD